jgi:hypothetical protein|nr:MAG TPA: hypothetical protein [Caudoviricetes sp.]
MLMLRIVFEANGKQITIHRSEEKADKALQEVKERGYRLIKTVKLYPVASWERNQHVFYNAVDRAQNSLFDARENGVGIEEAEECLEKYNNALAKFDFGPKDSRGVVYAEYNDYKFMKDVIGGYAERHNGHV